MIESMGCQSCSFKHWIPRNCSCSPCFAAAGGENNSKLWWTLDSMFQRNPREHGACNQSCPQDLCKTESNQYVHWLTDTYPSFQHFQVCSGCPGNFVDFATAWKKQAVQASRDGCWLSSASLGHTVGSGQCHRDNQSHVVTTSHCQSSQPACKVYGYRVLRLSIVFVQALDS